MGPFENVSVGLINQRNKHLFLGCREMLRFLKSHILQRSLLKIRRENRYFSFLPFCPFFSLCKGFHLMDSFVEAFLLIHISYDILRHKITQNITFYDLSFHMPYDIKCHKICQYGYQNIRVDQTN